MEHARKMIVAPQELFQRLQSPSDQQQQQQHTSTTKRRTYKTLDQEMEEIMSDKRIDDREKWKMYNQVLQRFLNNSAINRQPITLPIVGSSSNIDTDDFNYTDHTSNRYQQRERLTPVQIDEIVDTFTKHW